MLASCGQPSLAGFCANEEVASGLELHVVELPPGSDPADLVAQEVVAASVRSPPVSRGSARTSTG